jgi:phosphoribosylformylglycinamidine cyclo-ligase
MSKKTSYKDAGVDIDRANEFVEAIKPLIRTTHRKEVIGGVGGFGGLFHLEKTRYKDPILVSSTDGVGTKLKIAQMADRFDTIGIDLVAMSANDVLVQGAEPLFFLDYISTNEISVERGVQIIEGIVKGCREAGCALIGGETAEMPGFFAPGDYELVGFCVGIVEAEKLLDGSKIGIGDRIIGLSSNGLHSNGFSLARKVLFEQLKLGIHDRVAGLDETVGVELLKPTRIYAKVVLNLVKNFNIKGLVHITGGGFIDNIPRILPERCHAVIRRGSWPVLPVFKALQSHGAIEEMEMFRVFNMGIGLMIIVTEKECQEIMERLSALGEKAYLIGMIEKKDPSKPSVSIV